MALFPGLPGWADTRKVKPIWILLKQETSEWQWHQLGHMQVCTSLQTDNHASTLPLSFYRPDALPAAQPTASKHWRQSTHTHIHIQFVLTLLALSGSQTPILSPSNLSALHFVWRLQFNDASPKICNSPSSSGPSTNGHTGHVPRAPGFFFFLRGPQLAVVK